MTSMLSVGDCTRRQIRKFELLQIWSFTCPAGFCVARIRWTPRLLPILAALISSFMNAGCWVFSSANSSTTISRCGIASFALSIFASS